jgi:hypothetical protein
MRNHPAFAPDPVTETVWWTFPITEVLTVIILVFISKDSNKKKIKPLEETTD